MSPFLDRLPPVRGKILADELLAPFTWFRVGGAADAAEGVKSFLEKRPPQFGMKVSTDFPDWM